MYETSKIYNATSASASRTFVICTTEKASFFFANTDNTIREHLRFGSGTSAFVTPVIYGIFLP